MSTRSFVGIQTPDGSIVAIYVHFDGYPSGVGATLVAHYTDPAKLEQLMALGDLSILAPDIGEPHPFDDPSHPSWCLAYGRDRHEPNVSARIYPDLDAFLNASDNYGTDYTYIHRDGQWWVLYEGTRSPFFAFEPVEPQHFRRVAQVLAEEADQAGNEELAS